MAFFKNAEKENTRHREEVEGLLLPGERIQEMFSSILDYVAITNYRLLFNNEGFTSKTHTLTSIPWDKITAVHLEKARLLAFTKKIKVTISGGDYDINLVSSENTRILYSIIVAKMIKLEVLSPPPPPPPMV